MNVPAGFQFPESLRQCVETVFSGGPWGQGEYDFPHQFDQICWGDGVLLDIGANVGQFTRWACERWSVRNVHAYEPNPGAADLYVKNVCRVPPMFVTLAKAAVTTRPGPVGLYLGADWGYTSIDPTLNPRSNEAPISVRTEHPSKLPAADIVKIDAEGVELEILQHYPHLDRVGLLLLEIHRTALRIPCENLAIKAGLELVRAHRFDERGEEMALEIWRRPWD